MFCSLRVVLLTRDCVIARSTIGKVRMCGAVPIFAKPSSLPATNAVNELAASEQSAVFI